ncbi:MAG: hypothetical protein FWF02_11965 [Micrococcales bacterium]|nr:hypothetical protein [Micrococcales bacterium]
MAERLLLEGADLHGLMEYVRAEFGPGAKIVQAERVRQGGFAGFFAKEKYELTVEVPEQRTPVRPLRPHRPPPPAPAASSMDDLLAAADAADVAPGVVPAPEIVPAPSPDQAREEIVAAPSAAAKAATPRAATAGSQFATVLDQVRALADQDLPPVAPAAGEEDTPARGVPVAPLADDPDDVVPPVRAPAPVAPAVAAPVEVALSPVGAELRSALTQLGVPASLLAVHPMTLSTVLDQIPVAPPMPRRPGEVLAVIGAASDLTVLEPLLVERMRLAPSDVVHVGNAMRYDPSAMGPDRPTRVASLPSLSAWRSRAPMARHPWLVLIPVDGDAEARSEAAELAFTARPTQLWAVVDARTKPSDAARWLDQVGSQQPIDALAVRALADTSAPGTILGLGRPVAWLDGLPTSRVVWAAALGQPLDSALGV